MTLVAEGLIQKFCNSCNSYVEVGHYCCAGEVAAFDGAPRNDADQLFI
jgi:hypothetical protein